MDLNINKKALQNAETSYYKLFLLFLCGGVLGFIIEGVYCLVTKGHWESHVVSVFAPYNILYGLGAVLFYVGAEKTRNRHIVSRILIMTAAATLLELLAGLFLRHALGMRAWSYANSFLNFKGLICFSFSFAWGIAALIFCLLYPFIHRAVCSCMGRPWRIIGGVLSVFVAVDLCLTCAVMLRWRERHFGYEADNRLEKVIDDVAPDEWMQKRFIEWRFEDDK